MIPCNGLTLAVGAVTPNVAMMSGSQLQPPLL